MRHRLLLSASLALLGFLAATGVSSAAGLFGDRDGVMIGTGIVVIILLAVLTVFAAIKHALGLDKMPPAPPSDPHAAAHH